MKKKELMIEALKNRVLNSLNERDNPTGNRGERWFYEPINSCIRNLANREPSLKPTGAYACYERINGDKVCLEARYSENQKGNYFITPGFVMKRIDDMLKSNPKATPWMFGLEKFNYIGEWWCEKGKKEPVVDLARTTEHRKRIKYKEENPEKYLSQDYWDKLTKQGLKNQNSSTLPQARTMEDVKNGVGYIIKGMSGPVVKLLQKMLLRLEYDLGSQKDDGVFGEKTEDAVEKFQKDFNINPKNNVYGIFGSISLNKMVEKLKELKEAK